MSETADLVAMNSDLNNIYQETTAKNPSTHVPAILGQVKYLCYINYAMLFRLFELTYTESLEVKIIRHRL